MAVREPWKLNVAVRSGLTRCRESRALLVTLSLYLDELRAAGMQECDVTCVGSAIRRILARVITPSDAPQTIGR